MAETPVDGPSLNRRGPNKLTSQFKMNVREAREWAQKATFGNPRYRYRVYMALQDGTLNPMIEKAILDMGGFIPKDGKRDPMAEEARGLINLLLRKSLNIDPLAEAKPIGASSTALEPEPPALEPRASIIPPSRPKRTKGTAPPLRPGEEVMP